jgi:outer membrane protein OmpA-like peptidoglycan-associated protein
VYGFLRSFILDQPALCGTVITSYHTLVSDVEEYVNAQKRWTLPPLGPSPQDLAQREADSLRALAASQAQTAQILDTLDVTRFRIYFQSSTFLVDSTALTVMETLRSFMDHHPEIRLFVDGHSDTQGPAWYNLQLARQRAETVRMLLIEDFGIDAARLQVRSFGEAKPESPEDTPENTARNRRVQFTPR